MSAMSAAAASLASRAAVAAPVRGARRAIGGKSIARSSTLGRTNHKRVVVTAAADGDAEYKAQLSRALRTVDTAAVMKPPAAAAAAAAAAVATPAAPAEKVHESETPTAAAAATATAASDDGVVYTLMGPTPQKFGVAEGELVNVLTASGSFVTRAVSGALCEGWTPSVIEVWKDHESITERLSQNGCYGTVVSNPCGPTRWTRNNSEGCGDSTCDVSYRPCARNQKSVETHQCVETCRNGPCVPGECPEGVYTFGELGGRYLRETSDVGKYERPEVPIKLYEFEGCPFCRKVREVGLYKLNAVDPRLETASFACVACRLCSLTPTLEPIK
jgi:hypothetical protein